MNKFRFPIDKPYVIYTTHGQKIRYGVHRGIDVCRYKNSKEFATGYECKAPADGVVKESRWHYQGGNILYIDHGWCKSWMAHFEKTMFRTGESVKEGDIIGYVDTTPNNYWSGPTPHLHWHCYDNNGNVFDPLIYVKDMIIEPNRVVFNKFKSPKFGAGSFFWTKDKGYLFIRSDRESKAALMKQGDTITIDENIDDQVIGEF